MKQVLFVLATALILVGCGAGHANLTSITVSPQSATTTSSPQGQVGYTATGNFQNGKSRELSQVDGLSWKTSPTSTGTVAGLSSQPLCVSTRPLPGAKQSCWFSLLNPSYLLTPDPSPSGEGGAPPSAEPKSFSFRRRI